jgi:GAG-pre-integrase domain
LKDSFLLDSASSIHVSRNRKRFTNFRKAPPGHYAICGSRSVPILGYGEVDIELSGLKGKKRVLRLHDVAFCPIFPTNLASLNRLESRGIDWNHRDGKITFRADPIGHTKKLHHQYVIEQSQSKSHTVLATTKLVQPTKVKSQASWANPHLWHLRMGHVGPAALSQLGKQTLGVRIRGPSTAKCSDCALAKITQQISRRPDPNKSTRPFHKVHIDWFDLEHGWDGYQPEGRLVRRCVIIICEATGIALTYFTTSSKEDENLPIIRDAVTYLKLRHNLEVKIVRSDNEMNRYKTKEMVKQARH